MRVDVDNLRERISRNYLRLRGLARRAVVSLTSNDGIWQALGYRGQDEAGEDAPGERFVAELFPGIGIFARPAAGAKPEAVIIHIGAEPNHPVIIATRDRDAQVAVNADETVLFNSQSVVLIKADGTVEVRARGGVASALAKKSDVDDLRTWVAAQFSSVGTGHVHATPSGPTTSTTAIAAPGTTPPAVVGTSKLRGE
jgi:phage gp45-like